MMANKKKADDVVDSAFWLFFYVSLIFTWQSVAEKGKRKCSSATGLPCQRPQPPTGGVKLLWKLCPTDSFPNSPPSESRGSVKEGWFPLRLLPGSQPHRQNSPLLFLHRLEALCMSEPRRHRSAILTSLYQCQKISEALFQHPLNVSPSLAWSSLA